jgi:preprotein translocase subunit SecY
VNRRVSFSVHRVHFLYAMVIVILFSANIPKPIVQHIASDTNTASFQSGIDCHMKSLHWQ